jgi:hypothetical protein
MNEDANIRSATAPQKGRQRNLGATQSTEVSGAVLRPAGAKRRRREKAPEPNRAPTVIGSKVRFARKPVCCKGVCVIAMANEPHAGEFICADCGKHRAWMSHKLAKFIEETQRRFGAPDVITVGTAEERRELNNLDYELPDGARVEVVNPAYPPSLYLKPRLYGSSKPIFGAYPIPKGWAKFGTAKATKTQATVVAAGKTYREIADAVAFFSERYSKAQVHIKLRKQQEAPQLKPEFEDDDQHETQSTSATEQEVHMRASDMFPSKYLKSRDVKDKPLTATVSHLTQELVGQGKDAEKKPVLNFKDAKAMVLNKTNALALEAAFGDTESWGGKKIRIHCVETTYGGRAIDGIRVKPLAAAVATKVDPELDDEIGL